MTNNTFRITQEDNSPALVTQLTGDSGGIDLSGVDEIKFTMEDRYQRRVITDNLQGSVNIVDGSNGVVEYVFDSDQTNQVGEYRAEFEVLFQDGNRETFPTVNKIQVEIVEQLR